MLVLCFGVHYAFWVRVLSPALVSADLEERRAAMKRWVTFAVAWQVVILLAIAAYLFPMSRSHPPGGLWITPVLAAVVGTAVPLQVALFRLMRMLRQP